MVPYILWLYALMAHGMMSAVFDQRVIVMGYMMISHATLGSVGS
jgi:hypothetical protein